MPSKHYLPEMSDSPLHWVTRPLRNFMLRHTRRRKPAVRWLPDYRTTLYWNPSVEFDETGRATVEFYTSDAPADYDITIEGITQTGENRLPAVDGHGRLSGKAAVGRRAVCPFGQRNLPDSPADGNAAAVRRRIGREEGAREIPADRETGSAGGVDYLFGFEKLFVEKMPRSGTPRHVWRVRASSSVRSPPLR